MHATRKTYALFGFFFLVAAIFVLTVGYKFGPGMRRHDKTPQNLIMNPPMPQPGSSQGEKKVIARTPVWKHYQNDALGIEFDYPDRVLITGQCEEEFGDTAIFEDLEQSRIFLSTTEQFTADCTTEPSTLAFLEELSEVFWVWKMNIFAAQNETEITAYIKERYGKSCSLGKKLPTAQEGTFIIEVNGDGLEPDITQCPLMWAVALMYNPELKKFAIWDLGQEGRFYVRSDYANPVDQNILESFRFIN